MAWSRFLNRQDIISQENVCVVDNVQRYYGMFMWGGRYSTEGHIILWKAPLRICYIISFGCRGSWMLKNGRLIFQGNDKYFTAQQTVWCRFGEKTIVNNWILSAQ